MALMTQMIPSENRPNDTRFNALAHNELLLKPPFTMVITGSIGSGKSSLIWSLFNPKDGFYAGYYDYTLLFVGSLDSNKVWLDTSTEDNEVEVVNEWDEAKFKDWLKKLESDQMKLLEDGKQTQKVCLILDDAVTKGINSPYKITALTDAVQRCRHLDLTIVCATQCFRQLSRSIRSLNTLCFIITKVNYVDLQAIAEEHAGLIKPKTFIKMYRKVMKQKSEKLPYPYLVVNYQKEPQDRYWCTFNFPMKIVEEDDEIEEYDDKKDGEVE